MKKILFTSSLALLFVTANSQVIIDTVSTGATYANQVWYSLANDNQGSAPKNNWDLGFDVNGQGSTIFINSVTGTTLWKYPAADTSGWNSFDTTGVSAWPKRWNADTSWTMGAMGRYASPANSGDVDWGIYSNITHIVTGDSLYLVKLANGAYKKLQIISLSGGVYSFRYADINGANLQNASLAKSNYSGQNFGYYSLQNNAALSREPASTNWDLLFGQYTAFIPSPYTVTGILQNKGVQVAEAKQVANTSAYQNWNAHTFKSAINEIGFDWKVYTTGFVIEDSLVYFVKAKNGDIWKVIPTGFGGGSNGNYIFSKEKLSSVGIKDFENNNSESVSLYPNPSNGDEVTLIISAAEVIGRNNTASVFDVNGKLLKTIELNSIVANRLNIVPISTGDLSNGIYIIQLDINNNSVYQKLIINN